MLTTTKPGRCKFCRERMPLELARHVLHPDCIDPWLAVQNAKKEAARQKKARADAKVERAVTKTRKEAIKTLPVLKREAQVEFNKWVRARDAKEPCISCGKPPQSEHDYQGGRDAGHYRSVGAAAHLRFHEDNCHAQCVKCNQYQAGNAVDYRIGLVARLGIVRVEALEADNAPRKFTREELIEIKTRYRAKTKALLNSTH